MAELSLHRLIDLLNHVVQRCDALTNASGLDENLLRDCLDAWVVEHFSAALMALQEAASQCEHENLPGAAKRLRQEVHELVCKGTDILFHDSAATWNADEFEYYQGIYGPFPIPLADAQCDAEIQHERRLGFMGRLLRLCEYAQSLLDSVCRGIEANPSAQVAAMLEHNEWLKFVADWKAIRVEFDPNDSASMDLALRQVQDRISELFMGRFVPLAERMVETIGRERFDGKLGDWPEFRGERPGQGWLSAVLGSTSLRQGGEWLLLWSARAAHPEKWDRPKPYKYTFERWIREAFVCEPQEGGPLVFRGVNQWIEAVEKAIKEFANSPRGYLKQSSSERDEQEAILPTKPLKRPSAKAFQAYWIREGMGITNQTEIANVMTQQGVPATQGTVSKWLKAVDDYQKAGGIVPTVEIETATQSIDPALLDMGPRADGRTPRQRPRRDPDADDDNE